MAFLKNKIMKLSKDDIIKFYTLREKYNPVSDMIGVIGMDFKDTLKYIKKRYDKTYTILSNKLTNSIIVVKEDFLEKYIIMNTLEDLTKSKYKFRRYI